MKALRETNEVADIKFQEYKEDLDMTEAKVQQSTKIIETLKATLQNLPEKF